MLWIAWSAALAAAKKRRSAGSSNGARGWSQIRRYDPHPSSRRKPTSTGSDIKHSQQEAQADGRSL
jgi:hypothetical protein